LHGEETDRPCIPEDNRIPEPKTRKSDGMEATISDPKREDSRSVT